MKNTKKLSLVLGFMVCLSINAYSDVNWRQFNGTKLIMQTGAQCGLSRSSSGGWS